MGISDALEELGRYLDRCEERVQSVELLEGAGSGSGGTLTADLQVTLPIAQEPTERTAVTPTAVSITEAGGIRVEVESPEGIVPPTNDRVSVDAREVALRDDALVARLSVAVATDGAESKSRIERHERSDKEVQGSGGDAALDGSGDAALNGSGDSTLDRAGNTLQNGTGDAIQSGSRDARSDDRDGSAIRELDRGTAEPEMDTDAKSTTDAERSTPNAERTAGSESNSDGNDPTNDLDIDPETRDVPPFEDRELLEKVYESCDTFAEMPEAIGMDVTAETVRRYMIDHGIHEPNSYNTNRSETGETEAGADTDEEDAGDADDEEPPLADDEPITVVADGIGLPEDVTVDAIIDTVSRSNTIYEVQRDIGVDRDEALEVLRKLNLLDLVVGRLATEGDRRMSREEVIQRLREQERASAA